MPDKTIEPIVLITAFTTKCIAPAKYLRSNRSSLTNYSRILRPGSKDILNTLDRIDYPASSICGSVRRLGRTSGWVVGLNGTAPVWTVYLPLGGWWAAANQWNLGVCRWEMTQRLRILGIHTGQGGRPRSHWLPPPEGAPHLACEMWAIESFNACSTFARSHSFGSPNGRAISAPQPSKPTSQNRDVGHPGKC